MPRAAIKEPEGVTEEILEVDTFQEELDAAPDSRFDISAVFDLPEVRARMGALAQEAAKMAVAQTLAGMNPTRAPLTLRANVADRFITGSNNPSGNDSPHLKHYRCERLKSDKIVELDMDRLFAYLSGEKTLPENKEGNPRSMRGVCVKQGHFISFLNGHCYAYTENQVKQLEWMKTQPRDKGGLPDLYEDPGGEIYACKLCPGVAPFGNKEGWNLHMQHVHGVFTDLQPGVVAPTFANTSPDPFTAPIR